MSKMDYAKLLLEELEKCFIKNEKVKTSILLGSLVSTKYKGNKNIRKYVIEMSRLALKLKALKLELYEDLLVHLFLISFPT